MKRITLFIAFILLFSMALAACSGGDTDQPSTSDDIMDLGGKTVTVAVENAYPPFNFIDEDTNEAVGWDYDAVTEICERAFPRRTHQVV